MILKLKVQIWFRQAPGTDSLHDYADVIRIELNHIEGLSVMPMFRANGGDLQVQMQASKWSELEHFSSAIRRACANAGKKFSNLAERILTQAEYDEQPVEIV
jgi:hypothetical protein